MVAQIAHALVAADARGTPPVDAAAAVALGGQITVGTLDRARELYIWPAHTALVRCRAASLKARVRLGWTLIECARQLHLSLRTLARDAGIHQTTFWRAVRVARAVAGTRGELDEAAVERIRQRVTAAAVETASPAAKALAAAVAGPAESWGSRTWTAVVGRDLDAERGRLAKVVGVGVLTRFHSESAAPKSSGAEIGVSSRFHSESAAPKSSGDVAEDVRGRGGVLLAAHEAIQAMTVAPRRPEARGLGAGAHVGKQLMLDEVYAQARAAAEQLRARLRAIEIEIDRCQREGDVEGLRAIAQRCGGLGVGVVGVVGGA